MRNSHGGNSRSARKRRRRAAVLCQQMRHGDRKAVFSLLQRRRALQGIAKLGSSWRVQLMNQARLAKRRLQRQDQEAEALRQKAQGERQARERDAAWEPDAQAGTHGTCGPAGATRGDGTAWSADLARSTRVIAW
jgi:hypothetical protein